MFKLVPVLVPPPLRQVWTPTEPPRSPGPSDRENTFKSRMCGGEEPASSSGEKERWQRGGGGGRGGIPTPFFGLFDSNSPVNSLMCSYSLSTTLALPHFRNPPIWRPVSVYLSVRLLRHTCQGAGLAEGVHSGGRQLMWKVLLKCSFHINDDSCTGGFDKTGGFSGRTWS